MLLQSGMTKAFLYCDLWHLLNEVYPKKDSFGLIFADIREHVKGMLECETEKQFRICFKTAKKIIKANPKKVEILEDIYNNPEYYAGYFLKSVPGHLGKQGDSHAEQNHSSVVAYLGNGGSMRVAQQVCELIDRHKEQIKKRKNLNQGI